MGYACPVCEDPQADRRHLANHLAFTAIASGGDHEEWLDERVPGWGQLGEADLADRVVEHAAETEYPQVFEASGVEEGHDHGEGGHHGGMPGGIDPQQARARGSGDLDAETRAILEEARAIAAGDGGDEGDGADEAASGAGDRDADGDETE